MADHKLEPIASSTVTPKIDRDMLKLWKAGMDEMNQMDLTERRSAAYRERFASLTAIWRQAAFLGQLTPKPLDLTVNDTWQRLRKAYKERHA